MIRKRFPSRRVSRILGWTTAAIAWGAVGMAAGLAASKEEPPAPPEPATAPPTTSVATTTTLGFPDLPEQGLVIIRGVANPDPEPVTVVRRVVVQSTGSSPSVAISPAPDTQTSSGS